MQILDYVPPENSVVKSPSGLLRSQCQHIHSGSKRRCRKATGYDYRLCDKHLLNDNRVVVAKSRIPGADLGLYSVNPRLLIESTGIREAPKQQRHVPTHRRGEKIGSFAGELIDNTEYARRYEKTGGFAQYVVGIDDKYSQDESTARTAMSYANDGVNLNDHLLRRNYSHRSGTHTVWHDLSWPHVINAYCDLNAEKDRVCLYALCDLYHGDEILFSYSGSLQPSKDANGEWVRSPTTGEVCDLFWLGDSRLAK